MDTIKNILIETSKIEDKRKILENLSKILHILENKDEIIPERLVTSQFSNHTFLFRKNGDIYGWGDNSKGQLGINKMFVSDDHILSPIKIDINFKDIVCGDEFSLGLTKEGDLYSWGYDNNGQLGINQSKISTEVKSKKKSNEIKLPSKILFGNVKFKKIFAGPDYCFAISTDGDVYGWGNNSLGQLDILKINSKTIDYPIKSDIKLETFFCGIDFVFGIDCI